MIAFHPGTFFLIVLSAIPTLRGAAPEPPRVLRPAPGNALLPLADGSIEHYYATCDEGKQAVMFIRSRAAASRGRSRSNSSSCPSNRNGPADTRFRSSIATVICTSSCSTSKRRECRLGTPSADPTAHGARRAAYLRLHSTALTHDPAGFLIESVAAKVEPAAKTSQ